MSRELAVATKARIAIEQRPVFIFKNNAKVSFAAHPQKKKERHDGLLGAEAEKQTLRG